MKKFLGIFAHPDDETVNAGGTIAKYIASGWRVDLICATRGEHGTCGDVTISEKQTLADVRTKELEAAAKLLGVGSVTFLDYIDGTLSEKAPGEIEDVLIQNMEDIHPDVVLTSEPGGMTNHPDHIKLSYATTYAFQAYVKTLQGKNPNVSNEPKLYYACFPESIISYLVKQTYFPAEINGKPMAGVEDKLITTVINIKRFALAKVQALDAHRTQREILAKYVRMPHSPFFEYEYFILRMSGLKEIYMGKNDRVSDRL